MKIRVRHNFTGQENTAEMSVNEGDILTLLSKDVGGGWWTVRNDNGDWGYVPASYVDEINDDEPTTPSSAQQVVSTTTPTTSDHSSFLTPAQTQQFKKPEVTAQQERGSAEEPDWPDEDWDDDDDSGDNATDYDQSTQRGFPVGTPYYGAYAQPGGQHAGGHQGDLTAATSNLHIDDQQGNVAGAVRPKRNLNRFSNFVKTGLECYILEGKTINVSLENKVQIQYDTDLGVIWKPNLNPYTCAVTKHGKETKMKGLKTFISYDITPSTSNIVVRRRYKHFDWLMQRLEDKFIVTPLPPLPEKQIAGRFQEDFVEHRRNLLQLWVNYITRHPMLSQCDVWWHFMTCSTDDMKGWKLGKRKAEKDELVGANFFFSIDVNPSTPPLDPVKTTKQIDNFQRFVMKMDEAVRHLYQTSVDQSKKFSTNYSKDYRKLSESIKGLSSAFQTGTSWRNSLGLNEAIRQTSLAFEDISRLHQEEPKYDFEPMADILYQYHGLLASWPEILQLHKDSATTRFEQEKLHEEGKISESVLSRIKQRTDMTTYATLAEINHFHNERLVDFKQMMQVFLTAQINFHSDILGRLQGALNKINDA